MRMRRVTPGKIALSRSRVIRRPCASTIHAVVEEPSVTCPSRSISHASYAPAACVLVEDIPAENPEHFVDRIVELQAAILDVHARKIVAQIAAVDIGDASDGAARSPRAHAIRH